MIILKDIIDEFMLTTSDPDSYTHNVNRTLVLKYAKRGLEELTTASVPSIKIVQEELPEHKTLPWPVGAIDIIRMSIIMGDGQLHTIYYNYDNPISYEYLRDGSGNIVIDSEGNPLKAVPQITLPDRDDYYRSYTSYDSGYGKRYGFRGGYSTGAGQYKYNRESGKIHFFKLSSGVDVVFEYLTNPLLGKAEAELEIHDYLREALENWIYYSVVRHRFTVPANEKERARQEYYHALKKGKKRLLFNSQEIFQSLNKQRANLKW